MPVQFFQGAPALQNKEVAARRPSLLGALLVWMALFEWLLPDAVVLEICVPPEGTGLPLGGLLASDGGGFFDGTDCS